MEDILMYETSTKRHLLYFWFGAMQPNKVPCGY